jgi:hypothetical protein
MNHNLNDPRHPWSRLTAAARAVWDERDTSAPYGFATRVAALAFSQDRAVSFVFERFAFRALSIATLLAVFSVALNYEALSTPGNVTVSTPAVAVAEAELMAVDDAVAIVLDFAD